MLAINKDYDYFCHCLVWNLFFFFFSLLFRAALVAYGRSQARGQIGAVAMGLYHSQSNVGSKPSL